jgi:hypothetical protein
MPRHWLTLITAIALAIGAHADERKVLRLAFTRAETSMDPAHIVDLYSRVLTAHIFEAPYTYDHLARPAKFRPQTAVGMPEVSDDFRVWTMRIKPGIYFNDDPAFKGQRRELVAADYVYVYKRIVDPKNKSPVVAGILEQKFVGLAALRDEAIKGNKPFDYDKPIAGLRAPDRYTLRVELEEPRPRFIETLAAPDLFGAVAREVVEQYGDEIDGHPVGTGPFRLKSWRRSSEIVLERNPDYRENTYQAEPAPDDKEGQAILAKFKGRRIPMIDEVRVAVIEQSQRVAVVPQRRGRCAGHQRRPRAVGLLAIACPAAKWPLPRQARHPRRAQPQSRLGLAYFNMEDPVVGGYGRQDRAAPRNQPGLRRGQRIRSIRRGGIRAQSPVVPHTMGYDPAFKSEMSDYDSGAPRCSICMVMSTAMATAGATCPTAGR